MPHPSSDGSKTRHRAWHFPLLPLPLTLPRTLPLPLPLLLPLLLTLSACDTTPPAPQPLDPRLAAVVPQRQLTDPQATTIEFELLTSPNDIQSRVDLLWHYRSQFGSARAEREGNKHVLWLIEHQPRAAVLATPVAEIAGLPDPADRNEAGELWEKQIKANGKDARILGNAGIFHLAADPAKAVPLLEKAVTFDADSPIWIAQLAKAYHRLSKVSPNDPQHTAAKKAVAACRQAIPKARSDREKADLIQRLSVVAIDALDFPAAQQAADDLTNLASTQEDATTKAVALHAAHVARGRIDVIHGRIEAAAMQLKEAGEALAGSQASLVELDMSLARALLDKRQSLPVLVYLDQVAKVTQSFIVSEWLGMLKESRTPDFEGYLH